MPPWAKNAGRGFENLGGPRQLAILALQRDQAFALARRHPARWPVSRSAWRPHLRSVSPVMPSFVATACSAAHSYRGAGRCSSTSRIARSRTPGENRLGRPIDLILPRTEVSEKPGTLHEEITEFASRTIDPTIVVAGSRRLLIRPASWVERDGQLLTWSAIGRCGIGVGSHITRLWTR